MHTRPHSTDSLNHIDIRRPSYTHTHTHKLSCRTSLSLTLAPHTRTAKNASQIYTASTAHTNSLDVERSAGKTRYANTHTDTHTHKKVRPRKFSSKTPRRSTREPHHGFREGTALCRHTHTNSPPIEKREREGARRTPTGLQGHTPLDVGSSASPKRSVPPNPTLQTRNASRIPRKHSLPSLCSDAPNHTRCPRRARAALPLEDSALRNEAPPKTQTSSIFPVRHTARSARGCPMRGRRTHTAPAAPASSKSSSSSHCVGAVARPRCARASVKANTDRRRGSDRGGSGRTVHRVPHPGMQANNAPLKEVQTGD